MSTRRLNIKLWGRKHSGAHSVSKTSRNHRRGNFAFHRLTQKPVCRVIVVKKRHGEVSIQMKGCHCQVRSRLKCTFVLFCKKSLEVNDCTCSWASELKLICRVTVLSQQHFLCLNSIRAVAILASVPWRCYVFLFFFFFVVAEIANWHRKWCHVFQ